MINWSKFMLALTVPLLGISACATTGQSSTPALLSQPSANTTALIRQTITEALHGRPVQLAANSFTQSDHIYIETKDHIAPDGLPIMGRKRRDQGFAPVRFDLIKQGEKCMLVRRDTNKKYALDGVDCKAAPAANTP